MADTLDITAGAGTTIATQDEAGVHYQEVKLTASGTGTTEALSKAEDSAHASGNHGIMGLTVRQDAAAALAGTDADYQPLITDANGRCHVLDANSATIAGDTTSLDGKVTACNTGAVVISSGTVTTVSTVTNLAQMGGAALDMNEGVLGVGTQRVSLATDDDGVAHLATIAGDTTSIDEAVYVDDADWTDNTSKHMLVGGVYQSAPHTVTDGDVSPVGLDVNGNIVLGTSAKAIGKLAANTGVDIGNVDVTSVIPGVAATNLGKAEDAAHASGDVGVAAMSVRADAAAALSGADNDYQPLITDANGRLHVLDENSGAIKTSVEIIDDWDATHDSAASADGPQLMAAYDATSPAVADDGDAVRVLADEYGRLLGGTEKTAWQATYNSADASGEGETVHASAASIIIVVQSYIISVDAEMWVELQNEDSAEITGKFWLKAGGGVAITLPDKAPLYLKVNNDLEVITEGAGNISVSATGYTIPG